MYQSTQHRIDEINKVMAENIEKVLARGEKIDSLNETVTQQTVEARHFRREAKEAYLESVSANYGVATITFCACALFAVSVVTGQPWPLHLICLGAGGCIGWGVNYIRSQLHRGWLSARLFGESLMPGQARAPVPHDPIESAFSFFSSPNYGKHPQPSAHLRQSQVSQVAKKHPSL